MYWFIIQLFSIAIDQAVLLNELGRMFVHFNERQLAVSHYRKSIDVNITEQIPIRYDEQSYDNAMVPLLI